MNGEFAALGVKTRKQFQEFVEKIVSNLTVDRRYAKDGTVFYLDHQTVVVRGQRGEARAYRLDFDLGWEFYIENRVPKTKTSPGYDPVGNGRTY
ncbi:hypothetical protein KHC17_01640 [Agrobacterium salinitolerans]|uniref:hypothetical protein n=1 Tax=Agrobacterium salinitolerans TaxID=1183413 RepID=UPI001C2409D6|nr:hypothetical protein [Agrobacterium salinitolerans]QXC48837.1 hypothetical protein KHC17_01640 [Agrobacterium salinitolerans]